MRLYNFQLAAVSGAFSVLHPGLEEFFDSAFRVAERVRILVLDDGMAQRGRPYQVPPLKERRAQLDRWLRDRGYAGDYELVVASESRPIADAWLSPAIDCVVVSEEMFTAADIANRKRRRLGLPAYSIQVMRRRESGGEKLSASRLVAR